MLLSLFERMMARRRARRGDTLERVSDDPRARCARARRLLREFRAHRAVTLAGADASATSAEVREVWSR